MPPKSLVDRKNAFINELSAIEDLQERLAYLIDVAKSVPPIESSLRIEAFRIDGCVANLWLIPSLTEGRCYFKVDSDGLISKAVAFALADTFSGCLPQEIVADSPDFLARVGITQHLTPNRRNGLANVWAKIKAYAQHHVKPSQAQ